MQNTQNLTNDNRNRRPSTWSQREIVIVAALGVVFGMLYLAWVQFWLILQGIIGPLAQEILFGFWFVVSPLAAYIIRKPGAASIAEVIATIAEILTGNPAGVTLLVAGIIQGLGAEIPFALTRWRNYHLTILLASGASAAILSFIYTWFRFSYWELAPGLLITMFVLRLVSGVLLGGGLAKFLGDRLHNTGVLQGLALDRAKRQVTQS